MDCIFCKIVSGEVTAHKTWEDAEHVAILSRWPNTEGFSVVITKEHYPSYFVDNDDEVLTKLTLAAKKVSRLIDSAFEDVGRTGMIYEGFGVDHLHVKLFPMHGTGGMKEWRQIKSDVSTFFKKYPGYISSNESHEMPDEELAKVAEKIRSAQEDKNDRHI